MFFGKYQLRLKCNYPISFQRAPELGLAGYFVTVRTGYCHGEQKQATAMVSRNRLLPC